MCTRSPARCTKHSNQLGVLAHFLSRTPRTRAYRTPRSSQNAHRFVTLHTWHAYPHGLPAPMACLPHGLPAHMACLPTWLACPGIAARDAPLGLLQGGADKSNKDALITLITLLSCQLHSLQGGADKSNKDALDQMRLMLDHVGARPTMLKS